MHVCSFLHTLGAWIIISVHTSLEPPGHVGLTPFARSLTTNQWKYESTRFLITIIKCKIQYNVLLYLHLRGNVTHNHNKNGRTHDQATLRGRARVKTTTKNKNYSFPFTLDYGWDKKLCDYFHKVLISRVKRAINL